MSIRLKFETNSFSDLPPALIRKRKQPSASIQGVNFQLDLNFQKVPEVWTQETTLLLWLDFKNLSVFCKSIEGFNNKYSTILDLSLSQSSLNQILVTYLYVVNLISKMFLRFLHRGTSINDILYQGIQGGPRQPPKQDVIEQDRVGRQVKMTKNVGRH